MSDILWQKPGEISNVVLSAFPNRLMVASEGVDPCAVIPEGERIAVISDLPNDSFMGMFCFSGAGGNPYRICIAPDSDSLVTKAEIWVSKGDFPANGEVYFGMRSDGTVFSDLVPELRGT